MASTYIGTIKGTDGVVYPIGSTLYGTCGTETTNLNKVVNIMRNSDEWTGNTKPSFSTIKEGLTIHVHMDHEAHAAGNLQLVINGESKPVFYGDLIATGPVPYLLWTDNSVVTFTYDGTRWRINTPFYNLGKAIQNYLGRSSTDNYNTITAALGYTPAASASVGGHSMDKISGDNTDKRYRLVIS